MTYKNDKTKTSFTKEQMLVVKNAYRLMMQDSVAFDCNTDWQEIFWREYMSEENETFSQEQIDVVNEIYEI